MNSLRQGFAFSCSRVLASQRDAMKIARHFQCRENVGDDHSPGTTETLEISVVPTGLSGNTRFVPALEVPGYSQAAPTGREDGICQGYGSLRLRGPMFRFVFEPHGNLFGGVSCS